MRQNDAIGIDDLYPLGIGSTDQGLGMRREGMAEGSRIDARRKRGPAWGCAAAPQHEERLRQRTMGWVVLLALFLRPPGAFQN
jgi:hypothetical protein